MIYKNLIFVHIPRTGGTSIESSLGMRMGEADKHLSASELRSKVGKEKWEMSFVFSFVRNPWDRMISLYRQPYFKNKMGLEDKSLAYFIENYQPADWEKKFFYEYLNAEGIGYIGKYENRTEDLKTINQKTGVLIDVNIHERKTDRNLDYRTYYDDRTRQMVYDLYQEDIEKYAYVF